MAKRNDKTGQNLLVLEAEEPTIAIADTDPFEDTDPDHTPRNGKVDIAEFWAELPTKKRMVGKDGNGNELWGEYLELPTVIRHLQRIVGLEYSISLSMPHIVEVGNTKIVVVRATVHLEKTGSPVGSTFSGLGTAVIRSEATAETAIKAAETDAVKRALRFTGLGLWLYEREMEIRQGSGGNRTQTGGGNNPSFSDEIEKNFAAFEAEFGVNPRQLPLSLKQLGVLFSNRNYNGFRGFVLAEGVEVLQNRNTLYEYIGSILGNT